MHWTSLSYDCFVLLLNFTDCLYSRCLKQRTWPIYCHADWAAELSSLGSSNSFQAHSSDFVTRLDNRCQRDVFGMSSKTMPDSSSEATSGKTAPQNIGNRELNINKARPSSGWAAIPCWETPEFSGFGAGCRRLPPFRCFYCRNGITLFSNRAFDRFPLSCLSKNVGITKRWGDP